jgi:hypothetical protein
LRGQDTGVSPKGLEVQVGLIDRDCKVEPERGVTLIFVHIPEEPWKLGKRRSIARKNTGWKPMLHCFPDGRAISLRAVPGAIAVHPAVTTRRRSVSIGWIWMPIHGTLGDVAGDRWLELSRQRKVRTPKGGMPRENEGTWV